MVAIKICGVRTVEIATLCVELAVDFVGLNFVPTSRRSVSIKQAMLIRSALATVPAVGVFRDVSHIDVLRTANEVALPWVQLHGAESPDVCARIRAQGINVIKALPVTNTVTSDISHYRDVVDMILLDAPTPGSGTRWSWETLNVHHDQLGSALSPPIFMAGGLTPDNVAAAISTVAPDGVDVASGIETDGDIDPTKVRAFRTAVRSLQPA